MRDFLINGRWVEAPDCNRLGVINPATEEQIGEIALARSEHVDSAVRAAHDARDLWRDTPLSERIALIQRVADIYQARSEEMATTLSTEMGAPITFAREEQTPVVLDHISGFLSAIDDIQFETKVIDESVVTKCVLEPVGVCGLVTAWNWPMGLVALKVVPALLAGCPVVLKPSEIAPLSSMLFAEIMQEAGAPAGVFNMINGDGAEAGTALVSHPLVRKVSFTGSVETGKAVSKLATDSIKRVSLELGGKSPNIVFEDADVDSVLDRQMSLMFENTGQNCVAPSRVLVQKSIYEEVVAKAGDIAAAVAGLIRQSTDSGVAPNEICVLAPHWSHVREIARRLISLLPDIDLDAPGLSPFHCQRENPWFKIARLFLSTPQPA